MRVMPTTIGTSNILSSLTCCPMHESYALQTMVCPHPLHQASPKDLEVLGDRGPSVRPTVRKMCDANMKLLFSINNNYIKTIIQRNTRVYSCISTSLNQVQDGDHLTCRDLGIRNQMNINPGPRPIR